MNDRFSFHSVSGFTLDLKHLIIQSHRVEHLLHGKLMLVKKKKQQKQSFVQSTEMIEYHACEDMLPKCVTR